MKILFQTLFFFIISALKGQDIDNLASIPFTMENKKEIRIYRGAGITNGEKFSGFIKETMRIGKLS